MDAEQQTGSWSQIKPKCSFSVHLSGLILVLDLYENLFLSECISEHGTDYPVFYLALYQPYPQLTQQKAETLSFPLPLASNLAPVYEADLEVPTSHTYWRFLTLRIWAAVEI